MRLVSGDVILREFKESDIADMAKLANNKKISSNLRDAFPHPYTLKDAEEYIDSCRKQEPINTFAIEWKGKYVGNIGIFPKSDVYRKSAEIGYFIGEPYWNKGIATKAVKIITAYGLEKLKMNRIYAGVFEYNVASMKVLEKNGYVKDGIFRKAIVKNGKIWDEHRYSKVNKQALTEK